MRLFGYLKQNLRGKIYRQITESGVQFIKDLFDDNEKVYGKNKLRDNNNFEWLMIDSSYVKSHQRAAGARSGNQATSKTKEGST